MGGYDQVGRALRQLIRKGRLLKAGYGIYTRARPSSIDGQPTPTKGLRELATEALGRLGVETDGTGLQRRKNNPGADGPRDRRPRACSPHDHLQRCPFELRTCWTGASLRMSPAVSGQTLDWSRRIGTSRAHSAAC